MQALILTKRINEAGQDEILLRAALLAANPQRYQRRHAAQYHPPEYVDGNMLSCRDGRIYDAHPP